MVNILLLPLSFVFPVGLLLFSVLSGLCAHQVAIAFPHTVFAQKRTQCCSPCSDSSSLTKEVLYLLLSHVYLLR